MKIGDNVTSIGNYAFYNSDVLASLVIPDKVTTIGDNAFESCSNVRKLTLGSSVKTIKYNAFKSLTNLEELTIFESVKKIEVSAFQGCSRLKSVTSYIPADSLFAPQGDAFQNCNNSKCTLYVPKGAKEKYASTNEWKRFTNIVELEQPKVTITINQYGSATYCSGSALDFSEVEGLKAYAATGYNIESQVVTMMRVQTAIAGTGLFLKGEPGEYAVPIIENSNDRSLNMLVGTLEATTVNSTDGEMSNYKFTITDGDEAPKFYPFEDGTTLSAGKAYLQIPTAWLPATAQKSLNIRFDEGETTSVDEVKGENGKLKGVCYDLQGRKVEVPSKGLYIINGKKVIIK